MEAALFVAVLLLLLPAWAAVSALIRIAEACEASNKALGIGAPSEPSAPS